MRVADRIHEKLTAAFAPVQLAVHDESANHAARKTTFPKDFIFEMGQSQHSPE